MNKKIITICEKLLSENGQEDIFLETIKKALNHDNIGKIDGKIKQISSIFISYLLYKIVENTEGKIENKIFIEYITESLQFIQHVLFEGYKFNDQKIDYPDVRGFHEKIVNHNKSIKDR